MFENLKNKTRHLNFLDTINTRNKEATAIASLSDNDKQILINSLNLKKTISELEKENSYLEIENQKAKIIAEKEHKLKELQLSLEEEELNLKLDKAKNRIQKIQKQKKPFFKKLGFYIILLFIGWIIYINYSVNTNTGLFREYHTSTEAGR